MLDDTQARLGVGTVDTHLMRAARHCASRVRSTGYPFPDEFDDNKSHTAPITGLECRDHVYCKSE